MDGGAKELLFKKWSEIFGGVASDFRMTMFLEERPEG
jgi:hypothetical protein